ncbi:MAG: ABC transporter ATP-binding protein [Desulfobacterales bacterium]
MNELLKVEDLKVRFPVCGWLKSLVKPTAPRFIEAVSGVGFQIQPGETFGLVGESGSGKTTLGQAVIGLTRPYSGAIHFENIDITGRGDRAYKPIRRRMAMMFQDPVGCLSPRLKIRSILAQPLRIHGLPAPAERIAELLSMVGLPTEFLHRYPHQLSGGQARRVGLARALALAPRLIIADEPTAGLDVSIQGDILNLLARMQRETDVSILAITHNLAVIRHISDRMAIMYLGRFVELSQTEEIFRHPRHPYTHALLSANPVPDPDADIDRVELKGDVPSLLQRPDGCEFHTRCPFRQDRCERELPLSREVGPGHQVRCHFPLEKSFHS